MIEVTDLTHTYVNANKAKNLIPKPVLLLSFTHDHYITATTVFVRSVST